MGKDLQKRWLSVLESPFRRRVHGRAPFSTGVCGGDKQEARQGLSPVTRTNTAHSGRWPHVTCAASQNFRWT